MDGTSSLPRVCPPPEKTLNPPLVLGSSASDGERLHKHQATNQTIPTEVARHLLCSAPKKFPHKICSTRSSITSLAVRVLHRYSTTTLLLKRKSSVCRRILRLIFFLPSLSTCKPTLPLAVILIGLFIAVIIVRPVSNTTKSWWHYSVEMMG